MDKININPEEEGILPTSNSEEMPKMQFPDLLQNDLNIQKESLKEIEQVHQHFSIKTRIESMIKTCRNREKDVTNILSGSKSARKDLKMLVTEEIERSANHNLITPNFCKNNKHEHEVMLYDGTHWELIPSAYFKFFVKSAAITIGLRPHEYEDPDFMSSLFDFVAYRFSKPLEQIQEPGKILINVQNGTLEISSQGIPVLRQHNRDDGFNYVLPYAYDPNATCEKWHRFLNQMLPEEGAQNILAEYLGYAMTSGIKGEKMLVLIGPGGNGKSVILDVVVALFGDKNVSFVSLSALTQDQKMLAMLRNKQVNISYENNGDNIEHSVLKQVISGEELMAYVNYIGPIVMHYYAKLIASYNVLPKAENTLAYWRRIILMPLLVTISEKDKNIHLAKEIIAEELPGILNWVIEGLQRYITNGTFSHSDLCEKALEKYRLQYDNVKLYVNEYCEVSSTSSMRADELYSLYKEFCATEELHPLGKQKFYDRLGSHGFEVTESRHVKYVNAQMKPL